MSIEFTPGDALPTLKNKVDAMILRAQNLEPVMKLRAALLDTVIDNAFRGSRSPNGKAWAPLAESTIRRRRRGSSKPLVDTGMLRMSKNVKATKSGAVFGVSGAAATYAPTHQFGRGAIPARPFLPLDEDGEADFSSGEAKAWRDGTMEAVTKFVFEGE